MGRNKAQGRLAKVISKTLATRAAALRANMERNNGITDMILGRRLNVEIDTKPIALPGGFLKFDDGKTEWDLLPMDVMEGIVKVLMYGSKKYAKNNWRKGADWNRYYNAAIRHMASWQSREDNDAESTLHHLDHALCCLVMLRGQILSEVGNDDRYNGN